jgi:hypothetical protein
MVVVNHAVLFVQCILGHLSLYSDPNHNQQELEKIDDDDDDDDDDNNNNNNSSIKSYNY